MYTLHQWEREYEDRGEYGQVNNRLNELISSGLYIPRSLGAGLMRFLGNCLIWDITVGKLVDGGPEMNPLLRVGAVYKTEEKPGIIDEIQDMIGEGRITEIPDGSYELEEIVKKG